MAVELQDILKANLILVGQRLLTTEEEVQAFQLEAGTEVVIRPATQEPVLVLALDRERIVLETSPRRTVIQYNYPEVADFGRLAQVIALAIEKTAEPLKDSGLAYGYNVDAVFSQDSELPSFTYLARRLFDSTLSARLGWVITGGTANVSFTESTGKRWNITVEPRAFDVQAKIYLSVSMELESPLTSDRDEIEQSFLHCWEQANRFMTVLDGRL